MTELRNKFVVCLRGDDLWSCAYTSNQALQLFNRAGWRGGNGAKEKAGVGKNIGGCCFRPGTLGAGHGMPTDERQITERSLPANVEFGAAEIQNDVRTGM